MQLTDNRLVKGTEAFTCFSRNLFQPLFNGKKQFSKTRDIDCSNLLDEITFASEVEIVTYVCQVC